MWEAIAAAAVLGAVFLWIRGKKARAALERELEEERRKTLEGEKRREQMVRRAGEDREKREALEKELSGAALNLHLYSQLAGEEARTASQKETAEKLLKESERLLGLLEKHM